MEVFNELNIFDDDQFFGNVMYCVSDEWIGFVFVICNKELQDIFRWDVCWFIDVWVFCGELFVFLEGRF